MQSDSQLARIEESYYAKMQRQYDAPLVEADKLADLVDEVATEYVTDQSYLEEIMECDMHEFFARLAMMLAVENNKRIPVEDMQYERARAFIDLRDWLIEQASLMKNVQSEAAYRLQQETEYEED